MKTDVDNRILERLDELERKERKLPDVLECHRELLQIQAEAKSRIGVTRYILDRDVADNRLREGTPLLPFGDFQPDWNQVRTVFDQVVTWAGKDRGYPIGESEGLRKIGQNHSLLKEAAEDWYEGHSAADIASAEGVDELVLTAALAATLKPFLLVYAGFLLPYVNQESWLRGYCPVCGGKPDFAYLDKERGARWLLCSRCDAEWLFLRVACPYCGTQDQDALAYLVDEEESHSYRLYICERCSTYIKAVDLRSSETDVLPPLERMMTLDMDRQGREKGYQPSFTPV